MVFEFTIKAELKVAALMGENNEMLRVRPRNRILVISMQQWILFNPSQGGPTAWERVEYSFCTIFAVW